MANLSIDVFCTVNGAEIKSRDHAFAMFVIKRTYFNIYLLEFPVISRLSTNSHVE